MYHKQCAFPEDLLNQNKDSRILYFAEGFVLNHPKIDQLLVDIDRRLLDHKKYPIIKVTGPTGVGKTLICFETHKTVYDKSVEKMEKGDLPGIYVEVPALGDAKQFSWKMMYEEILEALMHPPIELLRRTQSTMPSKGSSKVFSLKSPTEKTLRNLAVQRIKDMNVKVIILDEIQHMFVYTEANVIHNLDVLKSLANITECQFILVGTYEGIEKVHWNGQNSRRSTNLHFRHYDLSDSKKFIDINSSEYQGFHQAYSGLLAHVPFHLDSALLSPDNIDEAYIRCAGCIGILKEMIERALDTLSIDEELTPSILFSHSMSSDDIETVWDEIEIGEAMFERTTFDDIRERIGIKKKKQKRKSNQHPGVRSPKRDPVC